MLKWLTRILLSIVLFFGLFISYVFLFGANFTLGGLTVNISSGDLFGGSEADKTLLQQRIQLPEGFFISVYALGFDKPRMMRLTSSGDLLVSDSNAGTIILLKADKNQDGLPDGQSVLLQGLNRPHGLDVYQDWLYIAESNAIGRVKFDATNAQLKGEYEQIVQGLADSGNHWTKTLRVGPDNKLYVTSGSTCNVCIEQDQERATMLQFDLDGSNRRIFASGLRNSVGFDWSPIDGKIYATDNGRDLLGDDFPPCELNKIEENQFYGWPLVNGDRVPDPDFGQIDAKKGQESVSPVHGFGAHTAPLGMNFIRQKNAPAAIKDAALVALHGSWNRSVKDGYKIVSLHWQEDGSIEQRTFASGFEKNNDVIGRPVDVIQGPDGRIYISDDYARAIYLVQYLDIDEQNQALTQGGLEVPQAQSFSLEQSMADLSDDEIQQAASQGEAVFNSGICTACHAVEASTANSALIPLAQLSRRYDIDTLRAFLQQPTPPMPPVVLDEDSLDNLAIYLLNQYP